MTESETVMGFDDLTEHERQLLKEHEAQEHERRMQDPRFARAWFAAEQRLNCEMAVHALLLITLNMEAQGDVHMHVDTIRDVMRTYGIDVDEKLTRLRPLFRSKDPMSVKDVREVMVKLKDE